MNKKLLLTSVTEKHAADPRKQIQSDEVSQAGSDGCGHIIWVDSQFPRPNNNCNHHQTWRWSTQQIQWPVLPTVLCVTRLSRCLFIWPKVSAATKAVVTLLAHRIAAWVMSTFPLVRLPRKMAATAARKPTTVAWTCRYKVVYNDDWILSTYISARLSVVAVHNLNESQITQHHPQLLLPLVQLSCVCLWV